MTDLHLDRDQPGRGGRWLTSTGIADEPRMGTVIDLISAARGVTSHSNVPRGLAS